MTQSCRKCFREWPLVQKYQVAACAEVPNVRLKSYGSRAFSVAAPKHWNEIPLDIKLSRSVDVFKSRLKTYLFRLAFN